MMLYCLKGFMMLYCLKEDGVRVTVYDPDIRIHCC